MSDITTGHYPYAEEFGVVRGFPEIGRGRDEILAELGEIADRENQFWREGRVSGTMYCGDMDHYSAPRDGSCNEGSGNFFDGCQEFSANSHSPSQSQCVSALSCRQPFWRSTPVRSCFERSQGVLGAVFHSSTDILRRFWVREGADHSPSKSKA